MSGLAVAGADDPAATPAFGRPAHGRAAQSAFIVFGGRADQFWLRFLRPGFRHCFAALHEPARGWLVIDPLSGRLIAQSLDVPCDFDLPGFYRRAGLTVLGPFVPGPTRARWLPDATPYSCVAVCRAVLGGGAPFALTPHGLFRALARRLRAKDDMPRKICIDGRVF